MSLHAQKDTCSPLFKLLCENEIPWSVWCAYLSSRDVASLWSTCRWANRHVQSSATTIRGMCPHKATWLCKHMHRISDLRIMLLPGTGLLNIFSKPSTTLQSLTISDLEPTSFGYILPGGIGALSCLTALTVSTRTRASRAEQNSTSSAAVTFTQRGFKLSSLTSLHSLSISGGGLAIGDLGGRFQALQELSISSCPTITTMHKDYAACMPRLCSLKLSQCNKLTSMGWGPGRGPAILQQLVLEGCDKLVQASNLEELHGLTRLAIMTCEVFKGPLLLQQLYTLQELALEHCSHLELRSDNTSLPPCLGPQQLATAEQPGLEVTHTAPPCTRSALPSASPINLPPAHSSTGNLQRLVVSGALPNLLPATGESIMAQLVQNVSSLTSLTLRDRAADTVHSFGRKPNIKQLDIARCSKLPCGINELTSLERLCITDCKGSDSLDPLANAFAGMCNLKELVVKGCDWSIKPESITCLGNLQVLAINLCHPTALIPTEIGSLTSLTRLQLVDDLGYRMPDVPPSLGSLSNLKCLHLKHVRVSSILSNLEGLEELEMMSVRDAGAMSAAVFANLTNLKRLATDNFGFSGIALGSLTALLELAITGRLAAAEGASFSNLTKLQRLHIHDFSIMSPAAVMALSSNLRELVLDGVHGPASMLPGSRLSPVATPFVHDGLASLAGLTRLEHLHIYDLHWTTPSPLTLPTALAGLSRLRLLELRGCPQLAELPAGLMAIPGLHVTASGCNTLEGSKYDPSRHCLKECCYPKY